MAERPVGLSENPVRPKRRLFLFVAVGLVVAVGYANISGFCFRQCRVVPDTELIEIAIQNQSSQIKSMSEPSREEVRKFLARYPKCCRVDTDFGLDTSWLGALFGFGSKWVSLVYELSSAEADAIKAEPFYNAVVQISSCGNVMQATGLRLTQREFKAVVGN